LILSVSIDPLYLKPSMTSGSFCLTVNSIKELVTMGLKVVASTSPAMISPTYKIVSKFIKQVQKLLEGHRQAHADCWFDKSTFIFEKYTKIYECMCCHGNAVKGCIYYIDTFTYRIRILDIYKYISIVNTYSYFTRTDAYRYISIDSCRLI
jgi:hypothetical protein